MMRIDLTPTQQKYKVGLSSRWLSVGEQVWVVIEKRPFGQITLKLENGYRFLDTTQLQLKASWTPILPE